MEQANNLASNGTHRLLNRETKTFSTSTNTNDSSSSANMTDHHEEIVNLSDFHDKIRGGAYMSASSEDDDSSSSGGSSYRRRSSASTDGSNSDLESLTGRQDTKIAAKLRLTVIALFVAMGILFPIIIYMTTSSNEVENFEDTFHGLASKLIDSMEGQLARTFGAVESLRIAVTSHATFSNATWPFVTLPDFDLRGESARDLGDVLSVTMLPLVTLDNRVEWEEYTVDNIGWLRESIERQGIDYSFQNASGGSGRRSLGVPDFSLGFSKEIFALNASAQYGVSVDETTGPYFPTWQNFPPVALTVNLNAISNPSAREAAFVLMRTGNAILSRMAFLNGTTSDKGPVTDYVNFLLQEFEETDEILTGAVASVSYPIFDGFDPVAGKIVGMFTALLFLEEFFNGVLPPGPNVRDSVVCVVSNECGDVVSYKVTGDKATYLGPKDSHNKDFDYLMHQYNFEWLGDVTAHASEDRSVRLNGDYCPYQLRVYPHEDMEDRYITQQPVVYSVCFAMVIFVVVVTALLYDFFVQRRMKRAVKSAQENKAIVSSLFPANVRARLIREEEERKRAEERELRRRNSGENSSNGRRNSNEGKNRRNSNEGRNRPMSNDKERRRSAEGGITDFIPFAAAAGNAVDAVVGFTNMALAPAKQRLKFFLNNEDKNANTQQQHQYDSENPVNPALQHASSFDGSEAKPIADLFPHCTVLFSDISGFTAWSSEREPEQVFTLLQTIFQKFDTLAKKRQIFKVETIGDCYVAVTGLPDPQPDHAIRMTKFARACMHKVSLITKRLEVSLGPGTADLKMRFGLHSGPVTAGVLRGEKSRFQLFGDTVNTASRMESTGQRNRIQISQSTAQLLIEAGKENWIQRREDVVVAKGKGPIQTYWVLTHRQNSVASTERPKFIQSNLHDSNSSDMESVGSGISLWGEEEKLEDSIGAELPSMMLGGNSARLIDWQVDLLLRLIKQILAGREANAKPLESPGNLIETSSAVFEEVSESIELPKFDPDAARARAQPRVVQVSDSVIEELREYVSMIAYRYRDNPFHNFSHANHVSMSANKLLSRIVMPEDVNYQRESVKAIASDLHQYTLGITSDPLTQFAIMFSTLVHDVDHSGVSNQQRGQEEPELAEKYHHKSVAEQNSIDIAWDLFMLPKFKNLQQAIFETEADVRRFRQLLVNLVMATDIFDPTQKTTRNMRWEKVFHSDLKARVDDEEYRNLKATIVIEHIIQAADVAHTMQHWQVYTKWNQRLFNEMYRAYEDGRSDKDPSDGWYKGELWFFDNYVIPLAKKLEECGVFGVTSDECLNYALENRNEWQVKGEAIVKDMVEVIKAKKRRNKRSPVASTKKMPVDKPKRRSSFGYYARRSATYMIALPNGPNRGESDKGGGGESESWDNDDKSIELRLNDLPEDDASKEIVPVDIKLTEKESNKTSDTIDVEDSDSDVEESDSDGGVLVSSTAEVPSHSFGKPSPLPTSPDNDANTALAPEYDSEDDDSVIIDA